MAAEVQRLEAGLLQEGGGGPIPGVGHDEGLGALVQSLEPLVGLGLLHGALPSWL